MILHFAGNGEQVQVKKTTNTQPDSGSGEIKSDTPKTERYLCNFILCPGKSFLNMNEVQKKRTVV